jgi:uncharacterized membrane protein
MWFLWSLFWFEGGVKQVPFCQAILGCLNQHQHQQVQRLVVLVVQKMTKTKKLYTGFSFFFFLFNGLLWVREGFLFLFSTTYLKTGYQIITCWLSNDYLSVDNFELVRTFILRKDFF